MSTIPVIDFGPFHYGDTAARAAVAAKIHDAAQNVGFMYLQNEGIPGDLVERAFKRSREFFANPEEIKLRFPFLGPAANHGYGAFRSESLHPGMPGDLKETFTMRNVAQTTLHDHLWPGTGFRDTALEMFGACQAASVRVLRAIALALGMPEDFFALRHTGENQTLRYLHYPLVMQREAAGQLGAGAHTDYGSITLLFQDEAGGLEVRDVQDRWVEALPIPGTIVVNTGDLLARWTNDVFRSTLHRVRPRVGAEASERYAIAFFCDPDSATEVACLPTCSGRNNPPRYPPVTAGEHIRQKINASLAHPPRAHS